MEKQTLMQQVQEIGVESLRTTLRGIVGKGPLVGFMLMCLFGVVWYFERERRDFKQTFQAQNVRIEMLEKDMLACMMDRMAQSIEIKGLKDQVATLIANTQRKK